MALTPEQRALLELAHERGLSNEEIGELTGIGAGEAARRVRAAEAASRRTPLALVAALAGLALLASVLALAGVFSSDGDEPAPQVATAPAPEGDEVVRIELRAPSGTSAQGSVVIGIAAGAPYLDLDLTGLEPAPEGGLHMLWVDVGGGRGVPLPDPIAVAADGSYQERLTLPPEAAGILEFARGLEVVLTDAQEIARITREAARAQRSRPAGKLEPSDLPRRPGEAVLIGQLASAA